MDLAELLMLEHSIIRRDVTEIRKDFEKFRSLHSFVILFHSRIEDEAFFPAIIDAFKGDPDFVEIVKRTSKDHLLISKLGQNIIEWNESGNTELVTERMELYVKLLTEHNYSEERKIFPRWFSLDEVRKKRVFGIAINRFKEIGIENYLGFTGISEEFIEYMLRDSVSDDK